MENLILYGVVAVLLAFSTHKDRAKTRKALMKGVQAFEGVLSMQSPEIAPISGWLLPPSGSVGTTAPQSVR